MHVHTPTRLHTDPRIQAQLENLWQKWVKGQKAEITLSPGEKRGRKGRKKDSGGGTQEGWTRSEDSRQKGGGVWGGSCQGARWGKPGTAVLTPRERRGDIQDMGACAGDSCRLAGDVMMWVCQGPRGGAE